MNKGINKTITVAAVATIPERHAFIEKRKLEIPKQISNLQNELDQLLAEHAAWGFEEWMQVATPWDASKELIGRCRFVDRERWQALLEIAPLKFVLVSVSHLRSLGNEDAAFAGRNLATVFSENKFPRTGFNHGHTKIFTNGLVEWNPTGVVPELDNRIKVPAF